MTRRQQAQKSPRPLWSATTPFALFIILLSTNTIYCIEPCTRQDYDRCIQMANPLLKDPHLIFPDNINDINTVCRRWNQFVDCVNMYMDKCFTESRKKEFKKAVEVPVDSVHQMCSDIPYQTEYLRHVPCIKSTVLRDERCGREYTRLVEQTTGLLEGASSQICCLHQRFRDCVLDETQRNCEPSANQFAKQTIDKALSFLRDQCIEYKASDEDCPILSHELNIIPDQRPSNSRPRPWGSGGESRTTSDMSNTNDQWTPEAPTTLSHRGRDRSWPTGSTGAGSSFGMTDPSSSATSSPSWLPASPTISPSRGSSFGRAITWPSTSSSSQDMSSSSRSTPDWLSGNANEPPSIRVTSSGQVFGNQPGQRETDPPPWYPTHSSNEIDEPNQQGLSHTHMANKEQPGDLEKTDDGKGISPKIPVVAIYTLIFFTFTLRLI